MLACLFRRGTSASDLVALAQEFSPRFEVVSPEAVVVDVGGLDRLVGDADAVGAAIGRLAGERKLAVTVTLASTRTAALLIALASEVSTASVAALAPGAGRRRAEAGSRSAPAGGRKPGPHYRLINPSETAAALAPLPVSMLAALLRVETVDDEGAPSSPARPRPVRRTRGSGRNYRLAPSPRAAERTPIDPLRSSPLDDLLQTLRRWGVTTLGALAALPPVDLFERLGTAGLDWQAVARGEDAKPLVRTSPEDPFEATASLEWPIDTLEPLSFVLSSLLEPLCLRLERTERGAVVLQTTLQLVTRTLYVRRLELPAPMRDVKVFRTLILLDLESHPPDAGIDRVTITIEPTPGRIVQHSLLTRARPSPEQVATLTARLTAVLGEGRVGAPALVDSYEPGAFALRPFDGDVGRTADGAAVGGEAAVDADADDTRARRPQTGFVLRRIRRPAPVRVERSRGRPVHVSAAPGGLRGGRIVQAAGPWRTSGAWWTEAEGEGGSEKKEEGRKEEGRKEEEEEEEERKTQEGEKYEHRKQDERRKTDPEPGARSREPDSCVSWDRDEWDVVIADGATLRLSRDRETGQWFVEGVLD